MKERTNLIEIKNEWMDENDIVLIERSQQGDEEAITKLAEKYKKLTYMYIDKYIARHPGLMEKSDMYQLSLEALERSISTFDLSRANALRVYYGVILERKISGYIRQLQRKKNIPNVKAISLDTYVKEVEGVYLVDAIENKNQNYDPLSYVYVNTIMDEVDVKLKQFTEEERKVYMMNLQGYSYQEVADCLHLKKRRVEYIVQKISKAMRVHLKEWLED